MRKCRSGLAVFDRFHARVSTIPTMNALPLKFLLMTLVGWVNRNQQDVIEYLLE